MSLLNFWVAVFPHIVNRIKLLRQSSDECYSISSTSGIRCTCFSLQSSTPSSISCCLSCKPSSRVLIWLSTYARSLCPRFLEERDRVLPSLLRKNKTSRQPGYGHRDGAIQFLRAHKEAGIQVGKDRRVNKTGGGGWCCCGWNKLFLKSGKQYECELCENIMRYILLVFVFWIVVNKKTGNCQQNKWVTVLEGALCTVGFISVSAVRSIFERIIHTSWQGPALLYIFVWFACRIKFASSIQNSSGRTIYSVMALLNQVYLYHRWTMKRWSELQQALKITVTLCPLVVHWINHHHDSRQWAEVALCERHLIKIAF